MKEENTESPAAGSSIDTLEIRLSNLTDEDSSSAIFGRNAAILRGENSSSSSSSSTIDTRNISTGCSISPTTTTTTTSTTTVIRHLLIDGYGGNEPNWQVDPNVDLFFQTLSTTTTTATTGTNNDMIVQLESICLENLGMYATHNDNGMLFPLRFITRLLLSQQKQQQQQKQASLRRSSSAVVSNNNNNHLKKIEIRDVLLQGTPEEWEEFSQAIKCLSTLEVFVMESVTCWIHFPIVHFINFSSLVRNIIVNSNNSLRELVLMPVWQNTTITFSDEEDEAGGEGGGTSAPLLLLRRPSLLFPLPLLQKLTLANVGMITNDALTVFFETLINDSSSDTRLTEIDLEPCEMGPSAVRELCRFLRQSSGGGEPNNNTSCSSLQRINIKKSTDHEYTKTNKVKEDILIELLGILQKNNTLQHFHIPIKLHNQDKPSPALLDAYKRVVLWNCTLLNLNRLFFPSIFTGTEDVFFNPPTTMTFYANLNNRIGRKRFLLESHLVSQEEWINILARVRNDLSCLYYFLKLNPLLCGCCDRD